MRSHRESLSKNKTTAVSSVTAATQQQNTTSINANNKSKINNNKTDDTNVEKIFQEEDTKIKNKCKFVKSCKPLVNHKFYLDIEKHNIFVKIETKIRELGGSIEFFLTKDITHFITDKKDTSNNCFVSQQQDKSPATPSTTSTVKTPQTPLTPNYLSPIAARTPSSNDLKTNSRIRTRADVMLHRARKGTCEISDNNKKTLSTFLNSAKTESVSSIITKNPLQTAESWDKVVWHTEYALKFLEKVSAYVKERYPNNTADYTKSPIVDSSLHHHHHHHRSKSAQVFKGNYIKIESSQKGYYRPYYKIFNSKWPVLSLKPHKKGVFPLTAVDENYFYNSDTKTIGKQKSKATTALVTSAAAAVETKLIKISNNHNNSSNKTRKSSVIDVKMTRKNRSTSKHIRVKTIGTTGTTNTTATTATTTTTATSNKQNISSEKQCGYCEICRMEYDALTIHLKSESHQNFVKNENNFLALDSLIKSSANMDKFLSLNSKTTTTNLQQTVDATSATNASTVDSITKRTSKRISNNGSQLKPTLPPLPAPPPSPPPAQNPPNNSPNQPNLIINAPQLPSVIMKCKSSPRKEQQQIEILEKTTTLGHTRQTRQSGIVSSQALKSQMLVNDDHESSINVMRARRQSVKKINYAEPKEDEENSVEDLIIGYNRNQRKKSSKPKSKEKPKSGAKERKNSSESEMKPLPLPLPTSLLYKVVEPSDKKTTKSNLKKDNSAKENPLVNGKNSKKQQTGKEKQKQQQQVMELEKEKEEKESKQPSPIIVKIRKVRQSELSILSGEAVNFMFPKRRSFSSDPTDIDRQTTSESGRGATSSSIICSSSSGDFNKAEEFKLADRTITLKRKQSNSLNLETSGGDSELKSTNNKRRRLNYDENEEKSCPNRIVVKIEKEAENYSDIRSSSPKLSLQRNIPVRTYERRKVSRIKLNQFAVKKLLKTEDNTAADGTSSTAGLDNEAETDKSKMPKTPSLNDIINEKLVKYKFAFERIPNSELWYQVFHRQDEGYEKTFEYYGNTVYRKLPYEMGPLPPSKKPLCALCHIGSTKATENDSANMITASTSSNSNTNNLLDVNKCPEPESMKREKYSSSDEENNSQIEPNIVMDSMSSVVKKHEGKSSICNRAAALLNSEMPRKSPREHASTLAILSCIIQRRQQQQQPKSPSSLIQIKKEFSTDNAYNSTTDVNNQICTQISENVKRLRRGAEKETTATTSASSTTTANNLTTKVEHLLQTKKSTPKKLKMIKKKLHPSSSKLTSGSNKKCKLQYDIDEFKMNKYLKDNKHVNVVKLEKDIDDYLMSSVPFDCDDDQNNYLVSSPVMNLNDEDNTTNEKDDNFVQFSRDIDLEDLFGDQQQYSGKDSRKGGFFGFNATNKKRKNKTGWPTAKRRTATRQHTKQQQQQQIQQKQQAQKEKEQQLQSQVQKISGSSSSSSSRRKKSEDDIKFVTASKSEPTTSGIATLTTTTNSSTIIANTTSSTYKCQKSDSDMNNISANSPITPPESDNDDDINENDDNDDDDDEEEGTERNYCDDTVSNSTITITNYKNSTTANCHLPSPQHISNQQNHQNFQNLSHNHNHHQNQNNSHNQSQNLSNNLATTSDKTDVVSDIFTVSSDSLDTVLDVGSQIKSEDQEEIIASSKCNGTKLNNSSRQYNNQNHHQHHNNHQTIIKTLIPPSLLVANRINDDKDMQMMDKDNEINGDNNSSSMNNGCRQRLSSNASGNERKISSSSSPVSPATSPLKRLQSLSMSANNKRIKYPNSLKLKAVSATANNSGGNINSVNLNLNSSLNLFYDSKNNSSNNNCSGINSVSFNSSKINAKKLSNLFNNGDRKDMKVVVVVKRERNNSISSNNDSSLIMNNSICSRLSSQTDEILNTKSTSTLTTSVASVMGTSSSFVETEMIKREQATLKRERETGTGNNNDDDDCSGGVALEESVAMTTSTPTTTSTTTATANNLSTISPRRLRKPRGRWYRER